MVTLLVLVFFAVFMVSALLLTASRTGASKQTEQTMVVLNAALATGKHATPDQIVDIRKEELLSALPVLNRWLMKLEVAPRLRTILYQADVNWTAGGLILMCAASFLDPRLSYLSAHRNRHFFSADRSIARHGAGCLSCSTNERSASTSLNKSCRRRLI